MAWRCSLVLHRKRTDNSRYCAFYTSTMLFALLLHNFAIESLSINCCRLWVQRFNCVRHSLYSSVSNLDFYVLSLISLTFLLHHYVAFGKEYIIDRPILAECRMRQLNQASFVLPYFVLFAFSGLCLVFVVCLFLICLLSCILKRVPTWMALYSLIVLMCH